MRIVTSKYDNFITKEHVEVISQKEKQLQINKVTVQIINAETGKVEQESHSENMIAKGLDRHAYMGLLDVLTRGALTMGTSRGMAFPFLNLFEWIILSDNTANESAESYGIEGNLLGNCRFSDSTASGSDAIKGTYNVIDSYTKFVGDNYVIHAVYDWPAVAANGTFQAIYWAIQAEAPVGGLITKALWQACRKYFLIQPILNYIYGLDTSKIYRQLTGWNTMTDGINLDYERFSARNVYFDALGNAYSCVFNYITATGITQFNWFRITNTKGALYCMARMESETAVSYKNAYATASGNYLHFKITDPRLAAYVNTIPRASYHLPLEITEKDSLGNIISTDTVDLTLIMDIVSDIANATNYGKLINIDVTPRAFVSDTYIFFKFIYNMTASIATPQFGTVSPFAYTADGSSSTVTRIGIYNRITKTWAVKPYLFGSAVYDTKMAYTWDRITPFGSAFPIIGGKTYGLAGTDVQGSSQGRGASPFVYPIATFAIPEPTIVDNYFSYLDQYAMNMCSGSSQYVAFGAWDPYRKAIWNSFLVSVFTSSGYAQGSCFVPRPIWGAHTKLPSAVTKGALNTIKVQYDFTLPFPELGMDYAADIIK